MPQSAQMITVVYFKSSIYENGNPNTIQTSDQANVYQYFSEVLNENSEDLAIFHHNKLLKRSSYFQLQNNDQQYEIHLIQEMKEYLYCYNDQVHLLKSIITKYEEQLKSSCKQQSQIIYSLKDNQCQESKIIKSQIQLSKEQKQQGRGLENPNNEITVTPDFGFQSMIFEMKSTCICCQNQIDEVRIQTGCYHNFHLQCFKSLIEAQIQTAIYLECICKKRLPHKILYLLKDDSVKDFSNKICQNQLIQIQNNARVKNLQVIKYKVQKEPKNYICKECLSS